MSMKNLLHPKLNITAYVNNSVWRCDDEPFGWGISWDIEVWKALWFVYPPEAIADELIEYLSDYNWTKEDIIKIVEKFI